MADTKHGFEIPSTIAVLLWLAVFPFWQRGSYSHITRDKWEGMLILTAVSVFLAIIGFLLRRKAASGLSRRNSMTALEWMPQILCLLYFLWVGLSAAFGAAHDQLNSSGQRAVLMGAVRYEGLVTQICYFLIFFSISVCRPDRKPVMTGAALAMLAYVGIVWAQYAGRNPFGLFPEGLSNQTNPEFQGTIGNIDMVSGYAVLIGSLLLAEFILSPEGGWLCLAGGLAAVFLEACIGVSSGILSYLFGTVLVLFYMMGHAEVRHRGWILLAAVLLVCSMRSFLLLPWMDGSGRIMPVLSIGRKQILLLTAFLLCTLMAAFRRFRPGKSLRKKTVILLFLFFLAAAMLFIYLFPSFQSGTAVWELQRIMKGKGVDWFGAWRLGVWRITLDLAAKEPVFGTGPDTFWYVFNPLWKLREAELMMDGTLEKLGRDWLESFDNPHNEFLAILSNNGFPALLLYLVFLGAVLFPAFHVEGQSVLRRAAAAAVLLYVLQSFFSFSNCLVTPIYWAMLGVASMRENTKFR